MGCLHGFSRDVRWYMKISNLFAMSLICGVTQCADVQQQLAPPPPPKMHHANSAGDLPCVAKVCGATVSRNSGAALLHPQPADRPASAPGDRTGALSPYGGRIDGGRSGAHSPLLGIAHPRTPARGDTPPEICSRATPV